jgi:hypothetical protein
VRGSKNQLTLTPIVMLIAFCEIVRVCKSSQDCSSPRYPHTATVACSIVTKLSGSAASQHLGDWLLCEYIHPLRHDYARSSHFSTQLPCKVSDIYITSNVTKRYAGKILEFARRAEVHRADHPSGQGGFSGSPGSISGDLTDLSAGFEHLSQALHAY